MIATGVGGTENGSQRSEDQTILAQIGATKDRADVGQLEPVALWDQRWKGRGATVTNRDFKLARQILHD